MKQIITKEMLFLKKISVFNKNIYLFKKKVNTYLFQKLFVKPFKLILKIVNTLVC